MLPDFARFEKAAMQGMVSRSCNAAVENGYDLRKWASLDIAEDMVWCDETFETFEPEMLVPFIEHWQEPPEILGARA